VGPNFLETLRIPLLTGRTYNSHDFADASGKKTKVVIVNQTFARRFFGKHNPVGQLISLETAFCLLLTAYREAAWGSPLRASRTFLSSVSTNVW
jgi:hypothetical protein